MEGQQNVVLTKSQSSLESETRGKEYILNRKTKRRK
jgi:hypothetical protein